MTDYDDDPTAQDVIDALRFVMMAQKDPQKLLGIFSGLLEWAPETTSNGGIDLLIRLLAEGALKVEIVDD